MAHYSPIAGQNTTASSRATNFVINPLRQKNLDPPVISGAIIKVHVFDAPAIETENDDCLVYEVHRNVLLDTSRYFQAFTRPEWTQNQESIRLIFEKPQIFQLYVQWMYSRKIDLSFMTNNHKLYCTEEEELAADPKPIKINVLVSLSHLPSWLWVPLAHAHVLGEQLLDSEFRRAILSAMEQVRERSKTIPGLGAVGFLYSRTSSPSKARSFLVTSYVEYANTDWKLENVREHAGAEFVDDVLNQMVLWREGTP